MRATKSKTQTIFEMAGLLLGSVFGAAFIYWAIAGQDDSRIFVGAILLGWFFPLTGATVGEWAYKAARADR